MLALVLSLAALLAGQVACQDALEGKHHHHKHQVLSGRRGASRRRRRGGNSRGAAGCGGTWSAPFASADPPIAGPAPAAQHHGEPNPSEELECGDIRALPKGADRCTFVREHCTDRASLLNYPTLFYCGAQPHGPVLAGLMVVSDATACVHAACRRAAARGGQQAPSPTPARSSLAVAPQLGCLALLALLFRIIARAADDFFSCILSQVGACCAAACRAAACCAAACCCGLPACRAAACVLRRCPPAVACAPSFFPGGTCPQQSTAYHQPPVRCAALCCPPSPPADLARPRPAAPAGRRDASGPGQRGARPVCFDRGSKIWYVPAGVPVCSVPAAGCWVDRGSEIWIVVAREAAEPVVCVQGAACVLDAGSWAASRRRHVGWRVRRRR